MCYGLDAEPPITSDGGQPARGEHIVLQAADGTRFAAYVGRPQSPQGAGVVILPDVRGLFHFYAELALRFAEVGIPAAAIDYFGRTAGIRERDESFDYMPHVMQTRPETLRQDIAAALDYLRGLPEAPRAFFTVGFCFGGSFSFLQAGNEQGLAGVVGFYGGLTNSRNGSPTPIERAAAFTCPVLGLFGGADTGITAEAIQQFDDAMTKAGVEHELVTYPGAPHSFFDRKQAEFASESADAWKRILAFIAEHK